MSYLLTLHVYMYTHVHSCTPMHTHETFMYNPVNVYSVHVILTDTACIYQAMKCTPCTLVYSTTILDLWSYIMPLMGWDGHLRFKVSDLSGLSQVVQPSYMVH